MATQTQHEVKSLRRSVLSDETYEIIRAMILNHDIAPGERINIDSLAARLGVSQTPIREALARLESDGLIAKEALKGYSTTKLLTVRQLNDLFQFRSLIEPWAAEQSAKLIDAVGIAALKAELQSGKTALKLKDSEQVQAFIEHDARFHSLIARISGSEAVTDAFERTHCHLHLFRLFIASQNQLVDIAPKGSSPSYQSGPGSTTMKEHDAITKSIIDGDAKGARAAMLAHIQTSLGRFAPGAEALNAALDA